MRVKGFQKENGGIRVELDEGQLLFWSVKNNIVRCIYTKEEVVRQGSPLGIQAGYRFDLQARNRAEALEISNGWLCVCLLYTSYQYVDDQLRWSATVENTGETDIVVGDWGDVYKRQGPKR